MKKVAKLKYKARVDALLEDVIETLHSLAFNFTIFNIVKGEMFIPPCTLTLPMNYLAMTAINESKKEFSTSQSEALQFKDNGQLLEALKALIDREDWVKETVSNQDIQLTDTEIIIKVEGKEASSQR